MTASVDARTLDEVSDALFARMASDPSVRDQLVELYYPLVEYLARRFQGRGEPIDDLIQVGSIGLLNAIRRFDIERGVKFSTYATPTIIGEIKRHFRDTGWSIRVPRRLQELGLSLRHVVATAYQELGRSPTIREIAERAGASEEEVLEALETTQAYNVASLDAPTDDEDRGSHADNLGVNDAALEMMDGWADVAPALRRLPERERHILYLRFVADLTQSEIAEMLGMSQMHVSRLLARTLRALREESGNASGDK